MGTKCAAKILGLRPPMAWTGVGTKHEAALACAWAIHGSVALVRSDSGTLHGIWRRGSILHAYRIIDHGKAVDLSVDGGSSESSSDSDSNNEDAIHSTSLLCGWA